MTDLEPQPAVPAGWYVQGHQQRWWDGVQWTDNFAPLAAPVPQVVVQQQPRRTNHAFHLIMSIVTVGLWIPVWIIVAIANS